MKESMHVDVIWIQRGKQSSFQSSWIWIESGEKLTSDQPIHTHFFSSYQSHEGGMIDGVHWNGR